MEKIQIWCEKDQCLRNTSLMLDQSSKIIDGHRKYLLQSKLPLSLLQNSRHRKTGLLLVDGWDGWIGLYGCISGWSMEHLTVVIIR